VKNKKNREKNYHLIKNKRQRQFPAVNYLNPFPRQFSKNNNGEIDLFLAFFEAKKAENKNKTLSFLIKSCFKKLKIDKIITAKINIHYLCFLIY